MFCGEHNELSILKETRMQVNPWDIIENAFDIVKDRRIVTISDPDEKFVIDFLITSAKWALVLKTEDIDLLRRLVVDTTEEQNRTITARIKEMDMKEYKEILAEFNSAIEILKRAVEKT